MPVVKLAPIARKQYTDNNGDPVVGGKLFTYAAGSTTKQATYTDNTGTTANTNPIILDAAGRTPYGVWYESGLIYKEVLAIATDTDPPTSPIYTADVLVGVNDTTTAAALAASSQWVDSGLTPTYVSATQFTLVGDQTAAFHVGRRLRFTVTAGTLYGRISVTAFGALTTVTVVLDSGVLDSGLSAVDVGILTAINRSMPEPSSVGYQPLDAELTAIAGLTSAADTVPSFTGSGTAALITLGTASGNIPKVGTSSATDTLAGLVELATTVEAAAGTDTDRAVTSAGVAAAITALAFDGSDYTRTAYTSPTRAKATNYTNLTGYPMFVTITMSDAAGGISFLIGGATIQAAGSGATSSNHVVGGIVLPGEVYRVNGNGTVAYWDEVAR